MVSIAALWLPILLSAVLVFVASSILHVVLKYHAKDYLPVPDEDGLRAAMSKLRLAPGQYMIPCPGDMKELKNPEVQRKFIEGPVAFLLVRPNGMTNMGKHLTQWFVYALGMSIVIAYLLSRTLAPDAMYLQIFRVAGTCAFLGYSGALIWSGIWKAVPWSRVWVDVFDGFVYALMTAGAFAGFWPR